MGRDDEIRQFDGRPSYRDLAALNFLPQHIVANPNTLFYKADTYEHRERLKRVMPFAFGVIDSEYVVNDRARVAALRELSELQKRKETYARALSPLENDVTELWEKARELGLADNTALTTDARIALFEELGKLLEQNKLQERLQLPDYSRSNKQYKDAVEAEERLQKGVDDIRRKIRGLEQLSRKAVAFRNTVLREQSRVINLGWLKQSLRENHECIACGSTSNQLDTVISDLESRLAQSEELSEALFDAPVVDKEIESAKQKLLDLSRDLNETRVSRARMDAVQGVAKNSLSQVYHY